MKPKSKQSFPKLLRAWREARGYTMVDAAKRLDIPYRTWQDWEAGLHAPRGFALRMITTRLTR